MLGATPQLISLFPDIAPVHDAHFSGPNGFSAIGQTFKRFLIDDKRGNGRLLDTRIHHRAPGRCPSKGFYRAYKSTEVSIVQARLALPTYLSVS